MKRSISFIVVLLLVFSMITTLIINFSGMKDLRTTDKIEIITTLFPQYDFAKQIAGDKANVTLLLPPGTESHTYEPTPQDMIRINNSELFIYTGKEMEPWADNLISGMKNDINVLDLSSTVTLINMEEFEEEHSETTGHEHGEENEYNRDETKHNDNENEASERIDSEHKHIEKLEHEEEHDHEHHASEGEHHHEYDPHIWLNPQYAISMVRSIERKLSEIDSQNAEYYKNNADNYIRQIQALDSDIEEVIKNAPNKKIAFGGAFAYAYFIERYDLDFISAYETCGENSEPSTAQIKRVVDYIKDNKIPVIFYKEYTTGNIAKTISDETGAEMLVFNTVHNVSKKEIENGATYVSIMRQNLENLKQALL